MSKCSECGWDTTIDSAHVCKPPHSFEFVPTTDNREAMTLEQVRGRIDYWINARAGLLDITEMEDWRDAIDAHLTRAAEPAAKLTLALDALAKIAAGTWNRRERHPQELREYAASILRKINKERGNG